MEPGVYYGLTYEDYDAIPAVRSSFLKNLQRSPAYMKHRIATDERTAAMQEGLDLHCALLEPERFLDEYVIAPDGCDALMKSGARKGQPCGCSGTLYVGDFYRCGKHKPEDPTPCTRRALLPARRDEIVTMVEIAKEVAGSYLSEATGTEVSFVWVDEETGLLCKSRPDAVCEPMSAIVEYKRTAKAAPDDFDRSIYYDQQWHIQAAHCMAGAKALRVEVSEFRWLAQMPTAPYEARIPRCRADSLMVGEIDRRTLLALYAACEKSGAWPGFDTGSHDEAGVPDRVEGYYQVEGQG